MTEDKNIVLFGAGCFWHPQKVYHFTDGVLETEVGYAGGSNQNPTYEQVCSGLTGHAEIVKVKFDDSIVKFDELLDIFWNIHDPTQINRQGVDIGTQYRSCIFTNFDPYLDKIKKSIEDMNNSETYSNPISTIIYNTIKYYPAEDYHQKYLFRNAL